MKIIYSPNHRCHVSSFSSLKALFKETQAYKWQIYLSIKKKIKSTYQQDFFGTFWSLVMPVIPMTAYMLLAHIRVFNTVENMPFVFYIAAGMLVWLLMATTIHTVMLSIKSEKAILTTTSFPVFVAMLSRLGEVLHDSVIRLCALVIIILWLKISPDIFFFFLSILALLPALMFAMGIGMILSILDVVIQDTRRVVLVILRYGLFVSSVIFPFPDTGIAGTINNFNIFNTYVNATRDLMYNGHLENASLYFYTSLASTATFLFAAKLVHMMDFKIRAHL